MNAASRSRMSPNRRPLTNAIRRWPRPIRWSTPATTPASLSTSTVGTSSGLEPCQSATTGMIGVAQVGEQLRLALHVAEDHDRVAVPRLEHGGERVRLVGAAVGVAEDHVVAAGHRLDRERLDRARKERVGDVAHDRPDEHRRCAAEPTGQGVGPVAEALRGRQDALPRLGRDGDARRDVVQDPGDRALRDPGGRGDVAHRRHARRPRDGHRGRRRRRGSCPQAYHPVAVIRLHGRQARRDRQAAPSTSGEMGWPRGLEPLTFGSTFRCSAD